MRRWTTSSTAAFIWVAAIVAIRYGSSWDTSALHQAAAPLTADAPRGAVAMSRPAAPTAAAIAHPVPYVMLTALPRVAPTVQPVAAVAAVVPQPTLSAEVLAELEVETFVHPVYPSAKATGFVWTTAMMRGGPSADSPAIRTIAAGEVVEVRGAEEGYWQIRTPDGDGWLDASFLIVDGQPANTSSQDTDATVVVSTGNLRAGPGTEYPIIGTLATGKSVKQLGGTADWARIRWMDEPHSPRTATHPSTTS